jgi:hypothetical protein
LLPAPFTRSESNGRGLSAFRAASRRAVVEPLWYRGNKGDHNRGGVAMQTRITRFKMRPEAAEAARELLERLKDEIMSQPGIERCIAVMNPDGSGYVIALTDERGSLPESVDRVRGLWRKFHDHLEAVPEPEIFEVIADWPA